MAMNVAMNEGKKRWYNNGVMIPVATCIVTVLGMLIANSIQFGREVGAMGADINHLVAHTNRLDEQRVSDYEEIATLRSEVMTMKHQ